ncbi:baculovirus repeated ORF [Spodoptera exempta nucleopolyhedrovirus]|uniref:Baculovirus repeated ORF n=1 Tax=Spodoptera exempta nucleopolyhedrovirus TaxID=1242863 RepID=A0A410S7P5_9ABAC|nr:baculovirus repeated ORF [Spodoptera exempta nucleopolyhedrovirus]QAT90352.1 baculovirus repeated ORF [Spodoptera exempta nucleopolyhedrovirus]
MLPVQIGLFKFGDEQFKLRYVIDQNSVDNKVLFVAKDVASALKYDNTKRAIAIHVDAKYKSVYRKDVVNCPTIFSEEQLHLHPQTIMINKSGVIQLIMKSKLPHAIQLQEWLLEQVIPQVLRTGNYQNVTVNDTTASLMVARRREQNLKQLTEQMKKVCQRKDRTIDQILKAMTNMYTRFHRDMSLKNQRTNEIIQELDRLASRAVEFPKKQSRIPMICIALNGNVVEAITGQRQYVNKQKSKRKLKNENIIVETTRANPALDWTNATDKLKVLSKQQRVKRFPRSVHFKRDEDVVRFIKVVKAMFLNENKEILNNLRYL